MFFYVVGVEERPISVCCVEYDQLFSENRCTIFTISNLPTIYSIGTAL